MKVHIKTKKILTDLCTIQGPKAEVDDFNQPTGFDDIATGIACRLLPFRPERGEESKVNQQSSVAKYIIFLMPWPSYADQQLTEHQRIKIGTRVYDITRVSEPVVEGIPTELLCDLVKP